MISLFINSVKLFERGIMIIRVIDYFIELAASAFIVTLAVVFWWVWCAWECAHGIYPGALWVSFNNGILNLIYPLF